MSLQTPTWLLLAALALWGSTTGQGWVAAALGLCIATPGWLHFRLVLDNRDLLRVADLCLLTSLAALVYFLAVMGLPQGLLAGASWLPATLCPLLAVQRLGREPWRWRHVFFSYRHSARAQAEHVIDVAPAFLATVLLSASVIAAPAVWFYPAVASLVLLWLFCNAPAERPTGTAAFLLTALLAGALGYGVCLGLERAQEWLEEWAADRISSSSSNPYRSQTRIGDLGRIKLSDSIVWRLRLGPGTPLPLRLRDGVFTFFDGRSWSAQRDTFGPFPIRKPSPVPSGSLELVGASHDGQALLALPQGSIELQGSLGRAESNSYGVVRLTQAPPWLHLAVQWSDQVVSAAPLANDLALARRESEMLGRIPQLAGLSERSPTLRLQAVRDFFASGFRYTLALGSTQGANRDLERFLHHDKAGHCEYFATATVLMLRHLGLPARYVTGYSVQEFSALEGRHIARQRDAHAWAEVWIGARWVEVDTTPADWLAQEDAAAAGGWRTLTDLLSWLGARFADWRADEERSVSLGWWWALALGASLVLGRRLWQRRERRAPLSAPMRNAAGDELVATLTTLQAQFALLGYARAASETPRAWLNRLQTEAVATLGPARLAQLADVVARLYPLRYSAKPQPPAHSSPP